MLVEVHVERDPDTGRFTAAFSADRLRVSGIPFNEVRVQGCCDVTMVLRGDRSTSAFTGTLRGDSLLGAFREDGVGDGRFAYAGVPQTAPSFEEREITFSNGPVTLAGSLLLPRSGSALPAVVFLHGSGAEGRSASRYVASKVVEHGIAALIFDKRGVGGSSGDWQQATPDDLAGDAAAAVVHLLEESRIDPDRIGIHGHSQGGTHAPLVAARTPEVAFVIGSAAAGLPTDSTEIFSILNSVHPLATSARDSADAGTYTSELVDVAYHGKGRARLDSLATALKERPWFFAPPPASSSYWTFSEAYGRYRPLDWWARVEVPVLLIYGAEDERVPAAESAARISSALLRDAGNRDVTVRIFSGADHTFRLAPGPGGWPVTAPDYIPTLLDWLARR